MSLKFGNKTGPQALLRMAAQLHQGGNVHVAIRRKLPTKRWKELLQDWNRWCRGLRETRLAMFLPKAWFQPKPHRHQRRQASDPRSSCIGQQRLVSILRERQGIRSCSLAVRLGLGLPALADHALERLVVPFGPLNWSREPRSKRCGLGPGRPNLEGFQ